MEHRLLILIALLATFGALAETPPAKVDPSVQTFLTEHCTKCHSAEKTKGDLRLDNIGPTLDSLQRAEVWQKILKTVNAGEMPPEDAPQPRAHAKADFLDALSKTLMTARRRLSDSRGHSTIRRLNRREYANTLHDLLGVRVDVSTLPPDQGGGTFDTVGSSLFLSSDQIEQYLTIGRRALDEAFALRSSTGKPFKIHTELESVASLQLRGAVEFLTRKVGPYDCWTAAVDASAEEAENMQQAEAIRALDEVVKDPRRFYRHWNKIKGAPSPTEFGFKDAAEAEGVKHQFDEESGNVANYFELPHVDRGSYLFVFSVRPQEQITAPKHWPAGEYVLRVRLGTVPGIPASRHFIEVGHPTQPGAFDISSYHHVLGTIEEPQTLEIPVTLTSNGSRQFAIREKRLNSREQEVAIAVLHRNKHKTWYPPAFWIDWMELEGPTPPQKHAHAFADEPVRNTIERFAARAFRGKPVDPDLIDGLVAHYDALWNRGVVHEEAVKDVLSIVLASPSFLYLSEPSAQKGSRRLSDQEVATRLSYFLWSAPPDQELLRTGLQTSEAISLQVRRLLDDPRSIAFVRAFTHQWLGLDRLSFFQFNAREFPEFDDSLKYAVAAEVHETFFHLLQSRGGLGRLLHSDEVTVNGLLAQFYGVAGVTGDAWRTVRVPPNLHRGGLLGMSAILAMGSNGERTSPVERGAWVLRKLLNDPPPPAPPNVPQISRLANKPLSPRERVAAHQEEPQCASCHRKIDPIGFGLENFDAIGRWRETETYTRQTGGRKAWPIDASGRFHQGASFSGFEELRVGIAQQTERFARGFTEALIEFALGRPCSLVDEPLVEEILRNARRDQFSLRSFIESICMSETFRSR